MASCPKCGRTNIRKRPVVGRRCPRCGSLDQKGLGMPKYLKDESGASAAEYALALALVAAAIIVSLRSLGGAMRNQIGNVSSYISAS